ncbi:g3379 [Coccomyxa viridis]|uniref:G3379 protein n=1 Tax=Coccomyxa viridis TaxID=1274662 RepID=A0ABP1FT05_9CHLO
MSDRLSQAPQYGTHHEMRGLGCLLVLALASQAVAARQLKWDWSSAHSLGQLTTATGANTNAGLLSTVNPGQGNDGGMLAGGSQTGGLGNANSGAEVAQPPLPPGVARPPAIPGTPAYARQQAALRRARAPAPAPAFALAPETVFAGVPAPVYVGVPAPVFVGAPAPSAEAGAEVRPVYVSRDALGYMNSALAPTGAPFGVGAPDTPSGFLPLLGPYPEQAIQQPIDTTRGDDVAVSRAAGGRPGDVAPSMAPVWAPVFAPRIAPAPAHMRRAPAPAPIRAPAPAPSRSRPFARLPNPFSSDAAKLIWTAG